MVPGCRREPAHVARRRDDADLDVVRRSRAFAHSARLAKPEKQGIRNCDGDLEFDFDPYGIRPLLRRIGRPAAMGQ